MAHISIWTILIAILIFGLLPKLNSDLQDQILSFLIDCVNVVQPQWRDA